MLKEISKLLKLSLVLSFFLLGGCTTVKHQLSESEISAKVKLLQKLLINLSPKVEAEEAFLLSNVAVNYSLQLADQYQTVSSPILQNVLVNHGLKERGLCIHWTEDLLRKLSSLQLTSLKLHWGVAHREDVFKLEHSSVVVSAIDRTFDDGIVLDPWRCSGNLYFNSVKEDKYSWVKQYNLITESILLEQAK